jgi:WD40 repeat protein
MAVLQASCFSCHNPEKRKGGLVLTSREGLVKGSENGPVVKADVPEASTLLKVLASDADPHMPPKKQLSKQEIHTLERWVKRGAKWDAAALLAAEERIQPVNLRSLPPAYRPVLAVAVSPDGGMLAFARGNQLLVHEVSSTNFAVTAKLEAHREAVESLAWSADGLSLASGGFRRVVIWDIETRRPIRDVTNGLVGRISALKFSSDGKSLVVADNLAAQRAFVRVIDSATGMVKASWLAHDDSVFALDISCEGNRIATAGGDKWVKLIRFAQGGRPTGGTLRRRARNRLQHERESDRERGRGQGAQSLGHSNSGKDHQFGQAPPRLGPSDVVNQWDGRRGE